MSIDWLKKEMAKSKKWVFLVLFIVSVLLALRRHPTVEWEEMEFSVFLQKSGNQGISLADRGLQYDFYRHTCPQAEAIVRSTMDRIYSQHRDISARILRLFFHDCFINGCDASVFLDDSNGDKNHTIERQAVPNKTLKGFDEIEVVKEELENVCPGVVSCADALALATRDAVVLAGGSFYPVFTGRRDSTQSYYQEAMAEIPKPSDNINQTLNLFSQRGFDERETVSLLGAHNVGKIGCDFVLNRLDDFLGTGQPDPSMATDFINEMRLTCLSRNETIQEEAVAPISNTTMFLQGLSVSISSGTSFDAHYYQNLVRGRGVLFADQQLMANEETAKFVRVYASDDGTTFKRDFARVMVKMSNLAVLTGTQGQVRIKCSLPVNHS